MVETSERSIVKYTTHCSSDHVRRCAVENEVVPRQLRSRWRLATYIRCVGISDSPAGSLQRLRKNRTFPFDCSLAEPLVFAECHCGLLLCVALRAYFHYGCALRCVASDSQR